MIEKLKKPYRVITIHGKDTAIMIENKDGRMPRLGIELDKSPFDYSPAYYIKKEIKKTNEIRSTL